MILSWRTGEFSGIFSIYLGTRIKISYLHLR